MYNNDELMRTKVIINNIYFNVRYYRCIEVDYCGPLYLLPNIQELFVKFHNLLFISRRNVTSNKIIVNADETLLKITLKKHL